MATPHVTDLPPEYQDIKDGEEFDVIKRRLYELTGCDNIFALAEYLGVKPAQITDARRRLCLPEDWLRTVILKTRANHAWIRYGTGERYL